MIYNKISQLIFEELAKVIDHDRISFAQEDLQNHSKDRSYNFISLPEVIIWPYTAQEISKIITISNRNLIPITVWGAGSSLEGNPVPIKGGIVLDMSKMNKVIEVIPNDFQVKVQPGIIGQELDNYLLSYGLWFPSAPGSKFVATIGGMIVNNAGGMHAVKYGVVGDWVLELEIVMADGKIIRVGSRSFKSVAGYDIKRLFIGSEGTLGVITEAVLKLASLPKCKVAVLASFLNNDEVAKVNIELLKSNIDPAAIEFMDDAFIELVNKSKGLHLKEKPTMLIELQGDREIILLRLKKVNEICKRNSTIEYKEFTSKKELNSVWDYRRAARDVLRSVLPNMAVLSAEVGVPLSQIKNFLDQVNLLAHKHQVKTIMFGHMGDGNFHGWALYEYGNNQSRNNAIELNEELTKYALMLHGTSTGEHGLGIEKSKFLPLEHPTSMKVMESIKNLLDPRWILNPGKIFPEG